MTPADAAALLDDAAARLATTPTVPADVDRTIDRITDALTGRQLDLDRVDPELAARLAHGLLRGQRARHLDDPAERRREMRIAIEQARAALHAAATGHTAAEYDASWTDGT